MITLILCLLSCFSLSAEPLAPELLTPYKTAWLEIPHTPYSVLIELNRNETTPWIKPAIKEENKRPAVQIKTNFSFVDPSLYDAQSRAYKKLPDGLYHWKDDATLLASQELKRLGAKANPAVGENNYLVRPFPKRLTGYALNKNGCEYTHLIKDGAAWNISLAKGESFTVLGRLLADTRLPKWDPENLEFTIASVNALFNALPKGGINYRGALSQEKREKLFNKLFSEEQILIETDILCTQESARLTRVPFETNGYEVITDTKEIGLITAYNPNKFELVEHESQTFPVAGALTRGFLVTVLDTKELEVNKRMGIINVHVQGGNGTKELNFKSFREQQLHQIAKYINSKPMISHWLVCGDFNTDGLDSGLYQLVADTLSEANVTVNPNASNKANAATTTKEGEHIYKQNDYVMVTPTFNVASFAQYPVEPEQLLLQKPQDAHAHYFSDHAVIKTTLSFSDEDLED